MWNFLNYENQDINANTDTNSDINAKTDTNTDINANTNVNSTVEVEDNNQGIYDKIINNNFTFWNILGYEDKKQDNATVDNDDNIKIILNGKTVLTSKDHIDNLNNSVSKTEAVLNKDKNNENLKKKKNRKKILKKKYSKNENTDQSPFLSDISSYADYYTSDESRINNYNGTIKEETDVDKEKNHDVCFMEGEMAQEKKKYDHKEIVDKYAEGDVVDKNNTDDLNVEVEVTEKNIEYNNIDCNKQSDGLIENDKTTEAENTGNDWLFVKIKEIISPTIKQEDITEMIRTKYNSFSDTNLGVFNLLENMIPSYDQDKTSEISKKLSSSFGFNHNSMEWSKCDIYNLISYAIYCINKELSANIELEAIKMMNIYNRALNNYKKDICFKDDLYNDLVSEGEENFTLITNKKNNLSKKVTKIDLLCLMNINGDNYINIIECQNVQTPKLNLDEIFKINVH
ncbi:conserved protein, unknown function [Hepatocystis sp. ex Piliocolobus tephrosceles]|nr:conserved protein, unknown function [Hepatocystis sp. ex Piliocolobus tephrosceles]